MKTILVCTGCKAELWIDTANCDHETGTHNANNCGVEVIARDNGWKRQAGRGPLLWICDKCPNTDPAQAIAFVERIARMVKQSELSDEDLLTGMNDADECIDGLIAEARELTGIQPTAEARGGRR